MTGTSPWHGGPWYNKEGVLQQITSLLHQGNYGTPKYITASSWLTYGLSGCALRCLSSSVTISSATVVERCRRRCRKTDLELNDTELASPLPLLSSSPIPSCFGVWGRVERRVQRSGKARVKWRKISTCDRYGHEMDLKFAIVFRES